MVIPLEQYPSSFSFVLVHQHLKNYISHSISLFSKIGLITANQTSVKKEEERKALFGVNYPACLLAFLDIHLEIMFTRN